MVLPAFLRQPGLVIQVDENELHFSKSHLWAEPLSDRLPKLMRENLQARSTVVRFLDRGQLRADEADFRLQIEFVQLQPNDQGEVVASGRFLVRSKGETQTTFDHFTWQLNLTEDGFPHAVKKIEQILGLLADEINHFIRGME